MKLEAIDIELLEAYWRAELDEAARQTLEKRLQEDTAFHEAAIELQQLQKGLHELQLRHWRNQLTQIEQKAPPIVLTKPVWWRRYGWVLIAGVLLLALLFILKSINKREVDPPQITPAQALAKENHKHFPYLGERLDDTLNEAAILYEKQRDYAKAEIAMLALFQETGDSSKLMYAALAAVGINQGARVIPILEQLAQSSSFESVQADLKWNLALGYLQAGSSAESLRILKQLTKAEDPWPEKAESLSKQILVIQKNKTEQ